MDEKCYIRLLLELDSALSNAIHEEIVEGVFRGRPNPKVIIDRLNYIIDEKGHHIAKFSASDSKIDKKDPKEPVVQIDQNGNVHEKCPVCGSFYIDEYCMHCGQAILWDK